MFRLALSTVQALAHGALPTYESSYNSIDFVALTDVATPPSRGGVALNIDPTFWQQYGVAVVITGLFVALLIIVALTLYRSLQARKKIIKELEKARVDLQERDRSLENANTFLRNVINQMPEGLFIKDVEDSFKYHIVNDTMYRIYSASVKDSEGRSDKELYKDERADTFNNEDQQALDHEGQVLTFVKNLDVEGKTHIYENRETVIRSADGHRWLIGMVQDVTEREETNRMLKEALATAERSDKMKSSFISNMSHEIRTPLNAIVGFSELMCEPNTSQQDREQFAKLIALNNGLLLDIVNQILDLSRIEAGYVQYKREEFDLVTFMKAEEKILHQYKFPDGVEFQVRIPHKKCIVYIDKTKVAQIINNFVTNAIKFTKRGHICMGYELVDEGIRIYVEDTGPGIPAKERDNVFQRFEKLDKFAPGTGLGLSIIKALAESDGCGRAGVDENQYGGSTFWVFRKTKILYCE